MAQEAPAAAAAEPKGESTEAADLGVMGVNLKDAVKFNWGFQGALQGAGTPNEAGIGAFIPLKVGDNSVFFLDTLANVNFSDFSNYSSIINTKVKGATISTSTRLGYRWLNKDRSWMFGVNAGYDSRPLNTGGTDNGVYVTDTNSVLFQQLALNLEAVSNKWFTSAYLLYPIGEYGYNDTPAVIN
ncbi:carbamoyl-phosphate synthase, partial [Cyanobium sp. T1G-Tous]|nr:carbamoyl-phosphate synthase [Cyanobium sp. T1G-Tous]